MRYVVEHEARLHFEQPVREHQCELRVVPRDDPAQSLADVKLTTEPEALISDYVDYFGNRVTHIELIKPHTDLITRLRATVDTLLDNPFDFPLITPLAERNWIRETLQREPRLWDYVLHRSHLTPDLARFESAAIEWPTYDSDVHLMDMLVTARDWVSAVITHDPERTEPQALAEVIKTHTGGAQDLAHLFVAIVRRLGFAARYVTGYREGEDEADATRMHAWAEVLIPRAGWRGFDPTAALVVNDSYVALSVGRDADDVPLLRSCYRGGEESETQMRLRLLPQARAGQQ
ncbi:MAG: transglutaminase family protein [Deltaproteobacteria bacterium]|nr:transglutaminase family protein [Deltaproteobacteria bacterium]